MEAKLTTVANLHVRLEGPLYEAMRRKAFAERVTHQQIVNDAMRAHLASYIAEEPSS